MAWLAFDADQQRQTQLLVAALNETSAIDELGLGVFRDLITGALHPGLTVLHTRAKYLLFIPHDFKSLSGDSADSVAAEAERREVRLISTLLDFYRADQSGDSDRGIIGRRGGADTRRPSDAYWGLLRRLDIVHGPGAASRRALFEEVAESKAAARGALGFRSDDDVDTESNTAWRELPPIALDRGFAFTREEADWLAQRFRDAERHVEPDRRSLIHWLLTESQADPVGALERLRDAHRPGEHEALESMPAATRHVVYLGSELNRVAYGARILYNYLCATGMPAHAPDRDEYVDRHDESLTAWAAEFRSDPVTPETIGALDDWARSELERRRAPGASIHRLRRAHSFLSDWQRLAESPIDLRSSDAAARLVTQREALLKPGRARINNTELLRTWGGESGLMNFDYNWVVARRVIGDVCEGLAANA
ncbi:DUF6361 family protein [Aeromicrobium wangtongii]|uniref:DUF6361 family protein n=1 Tax=Aeromicrobium wangtongii TaxID=2969247 RepID=UPI001E45AD8A|nr:DUF6361 family protein [Aeromicrobium wangtongii]